MQRSGWKFPYISPIFISKFFLKSNKFYTLNRCCTIFSHFIGKKVCIHSGRTWKTVVINRSMVGRKLGSYSITKIFGSAIALSMALKQRRKKEDKKRKKK